MLRGQGIDRFENRAVYFFAPLRGEAVRQRRRGEMRASKGEFPAIPVIFEENRAEGERVAVLVEEEEGFFLTFQVRTVFFLVGTPRLGVPKPRIRAVSA